MQPPPSVAIIYTWMGLKYEARSVSRKEASFIQVFLYYIQIEPGQIEMIIRY